ncbi:cystinosin [Carpediemonas membranifera]|uniref:Cystinosin n=1 Tax=Carpediemonas membranifera TaxID=201153 RepID=A0A8J6AQX6_9EUKA|nr:cystinosin [Carpediemonas membranifera]|eukprot:KAG9389840.1 cystinosin [Carpediemonas membranifera]
MSLFEVYAFCAKWVSFVVGWISFFLWSFSFYPQVILNFRRRDAKGLNLQFVLINLIGFSCYSVYNVSLFFIPPVQDAYLSSHPSIHSRGDIPVHLSDVIFSVHAAIITAVTLLQMVIFPTGSQKVDWYSISFIAISVLLIVSPTALAIFRVIHPFYIIACLGYVKTVSSLVKYIPQAFMNWRRKSTVGWSIGNILLDISGSGFNLFQTALDATVTHFDILANVPKLSLAAVSAGFDVLFIIQHYVLYRDRGRDRTADMEKLEDVSFQLNDELHMLSSADP